MHENENGHERSSRSVAARRAEGNEPRYKSESTQQRIYILKAEKTLQGILCPWVMYNHAATAQPPSMP